MIEIFKFILTNSGDNVQIFIDICSVSMFRHMCGPIVYIHHGKYFFDNDKLQFSTSEMHENTYALDINIYIIHMTYYIHKNLCLCNDFTTIFIVFFIKSVPSMVPSMLSPSNPYNAYN